MYKTTFTLCTDKFIAPLPSVGPAEGMTVLKVKNVYVRMRVLVCLHYPDTADDNISSHRWISETISKLLSYQHG